jgi:hypothetical protein
MSGLGAKHVLKMPLESGLGVVYVWLTQDMAERPDMSGQSLWNPARGWIYPVTKTGQSGLQNRILWF